MKIEEIEGVGPAYAVKLAEAGVATVESLLEQGGAAKGRAALAEKTGISEKLILRWVNHADLIRIKGVGPQFAELLEAAGVDTVKELRNRNAANLAAKLIEINEAKNIAGTTPTAKQVEAWIEEAKTLEPKVSH
ncbi:MAG: DUF4332 domain-containing protein [Acidobacteriota bacterium]|jgi:predicted flap endonuclease-1-like 5' DNA nuclease